jgi:hypothetical protein
MAYPDFGHDGDGNSIHDLFDHVRVALKRSYIGIETVARKLGCNSIPYEQHRLIT